MTRLDSDHMCLHTTASDNGKLFYRNAYGRVTWSI